MVSTRCCSMTNPRMNMEGIIFMMYAPRAVYATVKKLDYGKE